MKKFYFKYQNLLNVKEKWEEIIRIQLGHAIQKLDKAKNALKELEQRKDQYYETIEEQAIQGAEIGSLRAYYESLEWLDKRIKQQTETVQKCDIEVNKIRNDLVKISKEKRTFEELKAREQERFHYIEKKEEEKFTDQLVTYQYFKNN